MVRQTSLDLTRHEVCGGWCATARSWGPQLGNQNVAISRAFFSEKIVHVIVCSPRAI